MPFQEPLNLGRWAKTKLPVELHNEEEQAESSKILLENGSLTYPSSHVKLFMVGTILIRILMKKSIFKFLLA